MPVTACLLLGVKAVQSEDAEELLALQRAIRQVGQGAPRSIIAVDDVELEARTLQSGDTCTKAVGIAHHQRPRRSLRREVRALEELDEEEGGGAFGLVGCELPHAVDLPLVGELIGYGERLIGGEWRREAEVAEGVV